MGFNISFFSFKRQIVDITWFWFLPTFLLSPPNLRKRVSSDVITDGVDFIQIGTNILSILVIDLYAPLLISFASITIPSIESWTKDWLSTDSSILKVDISICYFISLLIMAFLSEITYLCSICGFTFASLW